ncbi:uncharacterized protein LOC125759101 [Rhipicephalus sanguineus]|uniref:uncharacterized protein LOC125759101 n=1 Tax=Rhipicephalus sanguineus TaxID=34632 RepID=UPI0020C21D7F|nr:uncharacterized protein LOC125759101 [Rhipicephalus sanguineus]
MDPRLVTELLRRLQRRQPPIMPRTAALVLECCTIRGASDCYDLLDMACQAVDDWSEVFREFDLEQRPCMPGSELQTALTYCGYPVSGEFLRLLRTIYSPIGWVTFDAFITACSVLASVCK